MARYIDAESINLGRVSDSICQWQAQEAIDDTPTADVAEVLHGKWTPKDEKWHCTLCDGIAPKGIRWKFCPHCGAKMDGEE